MAPTPMQLDSEDPTTYLTQALTHPQLPEELKPYYEAFQRFYDGKLWYQLTNTLESFITLATSAPFQVDLYHSFISHFSAKLNQLRLVAIGIKIARQIPEGKEGLAFVEKLAEKVNTETTQEAYVLAVMESAHYKLLLADMEGTKVAIDKSSKILEGLDSVDLTVHAAFYRVSGDYYKARADYADYYKNSLLYLACINIETDLSAVERTSRAEDLGISALLGNIYNFGELLMHPILNSLDGMENEWIKHMLFAFNAGDIPKFESIVPSVSQASILEDNTVFLRQKICLMALIEAVFNRPTSDRVLSFALIAKEANIPVFEVEHLVMKALSLKLICGTLDQVSSTASISWVQPRVLSKVQIEGLRERLAGWCEKVEGVGEFTKGEGGELFAK